VFASRSTRIKDSARSAEKAPESDQCANDCQRNSLCSRCYQPPTNGIHQPINPAERVKYQGMTDPIKALKSSRYQGSSDE
jgi:hypothetical protein